MPGLCAPVRVPAKLGGVLNSSKWGGQFIKGWTGCRDRTLSRTVQDPGPEGASGEDTFQNLETERWFFVVFFHSQPAHDNLTRREAGENNTCPHFPPSLGSPWGVSHWSNPFGSQKAKPLVIHAGHPPHTELELRTEYHYSRGLWPNN